MNKYFYIVLMLLSISITSYGTGTQEKNDETFTYASSSGIPHFDPYNWALTSHFNIMSQVYEKLTARNKNFQLVQGLAKSWKVLDDTSWEFILQEGVTFHDGAKFTAEDVYASWKRGTAVEASGSTVARNWISDIEIVSPYKIIIKTNGWRAALPEALAWLPILDKGWMQKHDALEAVSSKDSSERYTVQHANGTGPYTLASFEPNGEIVFERNETYWDTSRKGKIKTIRFIPIKDDATRVAALISGDVDLAFPIPIQDWDRVDASKNLTTRIGIEARVIFLGLDQHRDVLIGAEDGATKNPFKDKRVREAINLAIDIETINKRIMKGKAQPLGILSIDSFGGHPQNATLVAPYPYDVQKAKQLLIESGYPNGFSVRFDAPDGRYINDAEIAKAIAAMLAKINITATLVAQPRGPYFSRLLIEKEVSIYLLGWGPVALHNLDIVTRLLAYKETDDSKLGGYNFGQFNNSEVTDIAEKLLHTKDPTEFNRLTEKAYTLVKEDFGYVPLIAPPLSVGANSKYDFTVYPDESLEFAEISIIK